MRNIATASWLPLPRWIWTSQDTIQAIADLKESARYVERMFCGSRTYLKLAQLYQPGPVRGIKIYYDKVRLSRDEADR